MTTTNTELLEMCKDIANTIYKLYDGLPEELAELEADGEETDLYNYVSGMLDVNYILASDKTLRGVRLAATLGGPNIWIDTFRGIVDGYWGTDHAESWISSEVCDEINAIFADQFEI